MNAFTRLPEGTRAEVIKKHLVISPAPGTNHQDTAHKIAFQLSAFVEQQLLVEIYFAPIDVYFDPETDHQPVII